MQKDRRPVALDFENALVAILADAQRKGSDYIDVRAGDLHKRIGGYSGRNHRMPVCCATMRRMMQSNDTILEEPLKGQGASLRVRYVIPRMARNEFSQKSIFSALSNPIMAASERHDQRCKACKESLRKLLERIYGGVKPNYRFDVGTKPEAFKESPYHGKLKEIFESLEEHRGFVDFIKAETLPECDFFIPNPGFVVEFDESQHFTLPRKVSLQHYPSALGLGYDRKKWMAICDKTRARDNDPPYRDEQRAWYDTLRDFLPSARDLKPTVRLLAGETVWCKFDPQTPFDVKRAKRILESESVNWEIEVRKDSDPIVARVIIAGKWRGIPDEARELLGKVCENWPKGQRTRFLITSGGFIEFDWPKSITRRSIGDNKTPINAALDVLVSQAESHVRQVLGDGLTGKLGELTDYITLGVDSHKEKISTTRSQISELHIELVAVIDLKHGGIHWTGKSYPTNGQEEGLVRIADLGTHFLEARVIGKVMILGCHDLTVYNPRSANAKGWRRETNKAFRSLALRERPDLVLQHPHTTDSIKTWAAAWNRLRKELDSVEVYAAAGRYYEEEGERSELASVLERTKRGSSLDFIFRK